MYSYFENDFTRAKRGLFWIFVNHVYLKCFYGFNDYISVLRNKSPRAIFGTRV